LDCCTPGGSQFAAEVSRTVNTGSADVVDGDGHAASLAHGDNEATQQAGTV
jgi:hypothetical protein